LPVAETPPDALTDSTSPDSVLPDPPPDPTEVAAVEEATPTEADPPSADPAAVEDIADVVATTPAAGATSAATATATRSRSRRPAAPGIIGSTGRRKEAIARVRLTPGSGRWDINGRTLEEYFPNKVHQQLVSEPFRALEADDRFDVIVRLSGGGVTGQAGALRLGVARALSIFDPEHRPALKKAGFLTRDARVKERKKYGLKKARKAPQYSKR
jgi:small subunit ribosomal protein S9